MKLKIFFATLFWGAIMTCSMTYAGLIAFSQRCSTNSELEKITMILERIDKRLEQLEKTQACEHLNAKQGGIFKQTKCYQSGAKLK